MQNRLRALLAIFCVSLIATCASCDLRSGTAKREMEKFTSTPTPPILPAPTAEPLDPADVVTVDTSQEGPSIALYGEQKKESAACTKFNRVMVNGDDRIITIKGVCRQITINGDRNKVTTDAAMEFVFNGSENTVSYSRFANGKRPVVTENRPGNNVEKTPRTNNK